jgi:hypothetical protein
MWDSGIFGSRDSNIPTHSLHRCKCRAVVLHTCRMCGCCLVRWVVVVAHRHNNVNIGINVLLKGTVNGAELVSRCKILVLPVCMHAMSVRMR